MLLRIANCENDCDFAKEAFSILGGEIGFCLEGQSINTSVQRKTVRQQIFGPTIRVGCSFTDLLPTTVGTLEFQADEHAVRRMSTRNIENMCSYCAHEVISFSNLSRVILRCSSAAKGSSVSGSFSKRLFRIASISSEVLPVAQTMKIKPKRFSYS